MHQPAAILHKGMPNKEQANVQKGFHDEMLPSFLSYVEKVAFQKCYHDNTVIPAV